MRGVMQDHRLAGCHVQADADLVAHRPRRQEQGGLVPQQLGDPVLEAVDGRVEAALLVADLGRGHRPAHALARARLGVAPQVDGRRGQ